MPIASQQLLGFGATALGILLISVVLRSSFRAWTCNRDPRDLALSWTAGIWLLQLVLTTGLEFAAELYVSKPVFQICAAYSGRLGFHLLIVSIGYFLMTCAGLRGVTIYALIASQALIGAVAITFHHGRGWIAVDLVFSMIVLVVLAYRAHNARNLDGWLALATGIIGLGFLADSVLIGDNAPTFQRLSHYFFAFFLLVMCRLLISRENLDATYFQQCFRLAPLSGLRHDSSAVDLALTNDRRRIARDLHDGVGSQLTTLLSSLDYKAPDQQAVALALEQCLIGLKMTIDDIDSESNNLPDSLGRLRYRVQHCLDRLGVRLEWNIEMCAALEAFRGEGARHALLITQECLANVIRHADATSVHVSCGFTPASNQFFLEVLDDGKGIALESKSWTVGKGLRGMRQRARDAGGNLEISSRVGSGTRIKLTLEFSPTKAQSYSAIHLANNAVYRQRDPLVHQAGGF